MLTTFFLTARAAITGKPFCDIRWFTWLLRSKADCLSHFSVSREIRDFISVAEASASCSRFWRERFFSRWTDACAGVGWLHTCMQNSKYRQTGKQEEKQIDIPVTCVYSSSPRIGVAFWAWRRSFSACPDPLQRSPVLFSDYLIHHLILRVSSEALDQIKQPSTFEAWVVCDETWFDPKPHWHCKHGANTNVQ